MNPKERDINIGDWYAECCEHDLSQITTPEQLACAKSAQEHPYPFAGSWPTLQDAIDDLVSREHYATHEMYVEAVEFARQTFGVAPQMGLL